MNNNVFIFRKGTVFYFKLHGLHCFSNGLARPNNNNNNHHHNNNLLEYAFFRREKKQKKHHGVLGFNKNPLVTIQSIPKPPGFNGSGMSSESDPLSTFGTKKGYNLDVTGFLGWQNSIKFDYSVVASKFFYFHPYLGKIPILTDSFQMG